MQCITKAIESVPILVVLLHQGGVLCKFILQQHPSGICVGISVGKCKWPTAVTYLVHMGGSLFL